MLLNTYEIICIHVMLFAQKYIEFKHAFVWYNQCSKLLFVYIYIYMSTTEMTTAFTTKHNSKLVCLINAGTYRRTYILKFENNTKGAVSLKCYI